MKKILKTILMYATHLVTNLLIQVILMTMIIWYYDTSVGEFIICAIISLIFLSIDYVVNGVILGKMNSELLHKQKFHLIDLVIAIPNVWFASHLINAKPVEKSITASMIVQIIIVLMVIERIVLINKRDPHIVNKGE